MWWFDLSRGVTASALLCALLQTGVERRKYLDSELAGCLGERRELLQRYRQAGKTPRERIAALAGLEQKGTALTLPQISRACGQHAALFTEIFTATGQKELDPFRFFVYLSLLILLGNCHSENEITFSPPGMAPRTPARVLNFFKEKRMRLSNEARQMDVLLAAMLSHFVLDFKDPVSGFFKQVLECPDPCDPALSLRMLEFTEEGSGYAKDTIVVLESNIDDTTPEVLAASLAAVLQKGALDYTILPAGMKKNRLAFQIQVLCVPEMEQLVVDHLFKGTATFGIRRTEASRYTLKREIERHKGSLGEVRLKIGRCGKKIIRISPEFDDIMKISRETGISVQDVYNRICKELIIDID